MEFCNCCGKDVSVLEEKKQRRLLSTAALSSVLQALKKFHHELNDHESMNLLPGNFICRPCVRLIERYISVHDEILNSVQKKLREVRPELGHCLTPAPPVNPIGMPLSPTSTPRVGVRDTDAVSPALTATIHYKSHPKTYQITPSRRRICKPLIRKNFHSFTNKCSQNTFTKQAMIKTVSRLVTKEIALVCSKKVSSIFDKTTESFVVDHMTTELQSQTPVLFSLLKSSLKTRTSRSNEGLILVVIAGIIFKHRRSSCSMIQQMVSLVLYAGHASKQVYQRLQKAGLCMSHFSTIKLVNAMGENYDETVKCWKALAENKTITIEAQNNLQSWFPIVGINESTLSPATVSPSPPPVSPFSSCLQDTSESASSLMSLESSNSICEDVEATATDSDFSSTDDESDVELAESQASVCSSPVNLQDGSEVQISEECISVNAGYKIIFDNIDKNVAPRFMRGEHQTRSLHYVHSYAVKDRIDFSNLSSQVPTELCILDVIPNEEDYTYLKSDFATLISRMIVDYIPFFKEDYKDLPLKHIPHKYVKQMSNRSEVIPLGVLPKSETKYEDMTEILEHYQTYVPSVPCEKDIPGIGIAHDKNFITTLVGGDYLTVARARGAQLIRSTSELTKHSLGGMLPVAEDWHAKVCFMEVIWKRLYKTGSGMEKGTFYQLRNLINRRNVTKQVKSNVNANEDFMEVIVTGYVLVAVLNFLEMTDLNSSPVSNIITPNMWMQDDDTRRETLTNIASAVIDKHVDLMTTFKSSQPPVNPSSSKCDYTREVISLGLLYLNFKDAVREGDGERVIRMWKYFLLIFRATKHTNYAMEALTLLLQSCVLPPNLAEQVKWSRFINVHGQCGKNISCDLHMEHLNRVVKTAIEGLGANKTEAAIQRVGKCVGKFVKIMGVYDEQAGVPNVSGTHNKMSIFNDLEKVIKELLHTNIFDTSSSHASFAKLEPNVIRTLSEKDLKEWIIDNVSNYTSCHEH